MFELDEKQKQLYMEWKNTHDCSVSSDEIGAIGGRFSFIFIPTGLGAIVKIKCACGAEIDVTDYECW